MTDQTPATAAGRALVLRLASPDPLGPRSYAEDILEIEAEARVLDRDALAEALRKWGWLNGESTRDYHDDDAAIAAEYDRILAREAPAASTEEER